MISLDMITPRLKRNSLRLLTVSITSGANRVGLLLRIHFTNRPIPRLGPALELCHFGTIYGNRSPLSLFMAIESLFKESRITKDQLHIRLVGDWLVQDDRCETLAQELERAGFLRRQPSLPHEICLRQMALAQILLILQPAYPLQVPAKIYEYIATGRPILVIGGEGATAALVERHRLGKCCPNEMPAIKNLLLSLVESQLRIEPTSPEDREKFHYNKLTQKLVGVFDTICKEQKGPAAKVIFEHTTCVA